MTDFSKKDKRIKKHNKETTKKKTQKGTKIPNQNQTKNRHFMNDMNCLFLFLYLF